MIDFKKIIFSKSVPEILAIRTALNYVPNDVLEELKDKLSIFTMTNKYACRLSRPLCQHSEIIFISESTFPRNGAHQSEPSYRFFVFVLLHEIAHAKLTHKCPVFEGLSKEAVDLQEDEADALAAGWYTEYAKSNEHLNLSTITEEDTKRFRLEM